MVLEKTRHVLSILTGRSGSATVRESERIFLQKYAKMMTNRQNFYLSRYRSVRKSLNQLFRLTKDQ